MCGQMESNAARTRTHSTRFDREIEALMKDAWRVALNDPAQALFFLRTLHNQRRAARRRLKSASEGLHVPPLLIASITSRCNLTCRGCYSHALRPDPPAELPTERLRQVFAEASELGVSLVMLAGGEPLLRPDVIALAAGFPRLLFLLFTNGLLIDQAMVATLKRQRNLIPVLSLEGPRATTDARRGSGVFLQLEETIRRLHTEGIFLGTSLTVTSENVRALTRTEFVTGLIDAGCRVFFFVEYVPVQPDTNRLALSTGQKTEMLAALEGFRRDLPGLFVAFPGDEEEYGGCLAAGRGFVHLNASGGLEPCPFAPWSDSGVATGPLRDALRSDFLARIRRGHDRLKETSGGCALWRQRDWVESELRESRAG
jgi:MoaA/NifB/PqqE/SkfB family radical SAM enzyme